MRSRWAAAVVAAFAFGAACATFNGGDTDTTSEAGVDAASDSPSSPPEDALGPADSSLADQDASTLFDGLVGAWKCDEGMGKTAHDVAAAANDGTLFGAASFGPGIDGGGFALALDGGDSDGGSGGDGGYVFVAAHPELQQVLQSDAFTIALWANLASVAYDQRILAWKGSFDLKLNVRRLQLSVGDGDGGSLFWQGETDLEPAKWHHLAITFDHGAVAIYEDGLVEGTTPSSDASAVLVDTTGDIFIGATEIPSAFAKGSIADLLLWKRALSAAEVATVAGR